MSHRSAGWHESPEPARQGTRRVALGMGSAYSGRIHQGYENQQFYWDLILSPRLVRMYSDTRTGTRTARLLSDGWQWWNSSIHST